MNMMATLFYATVSRLSTPAPPKRSTRTMAAIMRNSSTPSHKNAQSDNLSRCGRQLLQIPKAFFEKWIALIVHMCAFFILNGSLGFMLWIQGPFMIGHQVKEVAAG